MCAWAFEGVLKNEIWPDQTYIWFLSKMCMCYVPITTESKQTYCTPKCSQGRSLQDSLQTKDGTWLLSSLEFLQTKPVSKLSTQGAAETHTQPYAVSWGAETVTNLTSYFRWLEHGANNTKVEGLSPVGHPLKRVGLDDPSGSLLI